MLIAYMSWFFFFFFSIIIIIIHSRQYILFIHAQKCSAINSLRPSDAYMRR